jgi:hypothetical protein
VDSGTYLDTVEERKISSLCRESNPSQPASRSSLYLIRYSGSSVSSKEIINYGKINLINTNLVLLYYIYTHHKNILHERCVCLLIVRFVLIAGHLDFKCQYYFKWLSL